MDDPNQTAEPSHEELIALVDKLRRCLLPVWMGMAEREMIGEPMSDDAVVLSYMGCGASDRVTAREIRECMP